MTVAATAVGAIRPATPADVDAIRGLVHAAFSPYVPRLGGHLPAPMEADYAALVAGPCPARPTDTPPPCRGGGPPEATEQAADAATRQGGNTSDIPGIDQAAAADHGEVCAPSLVHVLTDAEGGLAGMIVLRPEPDHLLVETIAVHPTRQGTGIGRRLLCFAEDRALALEVEELRLYTAEAMIENLALYRRCGWSETGRAAPTGIPRVCFRKSASRRPPRR